MFSYLLRRLGAAIPVLLGALTISFLILQLVPGDPVRLMLDAGNGVVDPVRERALRHALGLDRSLPARFVTYVGRAIQGNLGTSIQSKESVVASLRRAAPASLSLAGAALLLALVLGVTIAVAGVWTKRPWLRSALSTIEVFNVSLPAFWVGIMLMTVFSFKLGWFPATGNDGLSSLVLPAITLALPTAGVFAQVLGSSLRRSLTEPFIVTARAKGAKDFAVYVRHALRNALIPLVTIAGTAIGNLLAGAVLIETVFARQGLGRVAVGAINARDLPVVQGFVLFVGVTYVVVNLIVDLLYAVVDPRVTVVAQAV